MTDLNPVPMTKVNGRQHAAESELHVDVYRSTTFLAMYEDGHRVRLYDIDAQDWDAMIDAAIAQRAVYRAEREVDAHTAECIHGECQHTPQYEPETRPTL